MISKTRVAPLLLLSLFLLGAGPLIPHSVSATSSSIHVVATIPLGNSPTYSVYNPSNKYVYVINSNSDYNNPRNATVSIINSTSNMVVATVKIGMGQYTDGQGQIIYVPSSKEVYVINDYSNSISVLRGIRLIATLTTGNSPVNMAYNPTNKYVYASMFNGVDVIDTTTNKIVTVVSSSNPSLYSYNGILYNPSNNEMYVSAWASSTSSTTAVVVIKGTQIVVTTKIPTNYVVGVGVFDPANKDVYLIYSYEPNNNLLSTGLMLFSSSSNNVVGTVKVGTHSSYISSVAYDSASKNIYISDFANPNSVNIGVNVSMVSSITNKLTVIVQNSPSGSNREMTFDPSNNDLYVPSLVEKVFIINPSNTVTSLRISTSTSSGAIGSIYNPSNHDVYIVNNDVNGFVSVVSS